MARRAGSRDIAADYSSGAVAPGPGGAVRSARRWAAGVEHLQDLTDAVAGELHELGRDPDRLVARRDLDQREPVDQLLGLRERTIGDADLAVLARELDTAGRADQPAGHHDDAGLDILLGERTDRGHVLG